MKAHYVDGGSPLGLDIATDPTGGLPLTGAKRSLVRRRENRLRERLAYCSPLLFLGDVTEFGVQPLKEYTFQNQKHSSGLNPDPLKG